VIGRALGSGPAAAGSCRLPYITEAEPIDQRHEPYPMRSRHFRAMFLTPKMHKALARIRNPDAPSATLDTTRVEPLPPIDLVPS